VGAEKELKEDASNAGAVPHGDERKNKREFKAESSSMPSRWIGA
jgi:hypothetical protein